MAKGIFITATGTDIGKTYISALLVKKIREFGINCGYYKPVLSGAEMIDRALVPGDCKYVLDIAGIDENPVKYVSYMFKEAVSPHLAAKLEGKSIKKEKIQDDFDKIKTEYEYIVIEGAGGIFCPLNLEKEPIILPDIINMLGLDIVIVASAEIGTLNSTVLTVDYAKTKGIEVKGIILNNFDESNIMHQDNKKYLTQITGINVITTVEKNQNEIDIDKNDLLEIFKEI